MDILLGNAHNALENDHVYTPEPKSAFSYYQQVLAIDPDNSTAVLGLSEIADKILMDARTMLGNNRFSQAEKLLAQAESTELNNPDLADFKQELSAAKLKKLLARADEAYIRHQYTTPSSNNALALYNQVLLLAPGNSQAIARKQKMADFYAGKAGAQIRSGNLSSAQKNINTLSSHFPDHTGTAKLKTSLDRKRQQHASQKADPVQGIRHLIPVGINQKQDEAQVVQDIVGQFILHFNNLDIRNMKKVSQMNAQQERLYSSLFELYKSMSLELVPRSFSVNKKQGVASVKFLITDLISKDGNRVQTTANWAKFDLDISRKRGYWLKAIINND